MIQTRLNFLAFNLIFKSLASVFILISGLGVFLSFLYLGVLLVLSYLLADLLREQVLFVKDISNIFLIVHLSRHIILPSYFFVK